MPGRPSAYVAARHARTSVGLCRCPPAVPGRPSAYVAARRAYVGRPGTSAYGRPSAYVPRPPCQDVRRPMSLPVRPRQVTMSRLYTRHPVKPLLARLVCKGFYPPLDGNCTSRRSARLFRRDDRANDTCPWGPRPLRGSASGRRAHASLLARIRLRGVRS
ncbi:hypothetical protein RND71_019086 [Anisodus tanguticus]|uniref:Uncharacterized protein n=1 Tax=Anisodus tanguticus TaxID=243964 RepID=A0AAE1RWV6_9SOLA|nr:hypothetical protein RND71_019086 [Anisodus tanguticus]